MTKLMLFALAIPAIVVLFNTICTINSMDKATNEFIRWGRIFIAIGAFAEILAFITCMIISYGTWDGLRFMVFGAFMINAGYAIIYIKNHTKCTCNKCIYTINSDDHAKEC